MRNSGQSGRGEAGRGAVRAPESLIANLELEFHVSPIRITKLKFSNRKFFAIFSSKRVTDGASSAAFSSSSKPQASSFQKPWPPWRLIYGTAIRNRANSRGLNNVQFSNRIIPLTQNRSILPLVNRKEQGCALCAISSRLWC